MKPTSRPLLACLLPVRNGAAHIGGWIESVERFADVVVALDDGSTDDTGERLAASPVVARLLDNPARPTYRGWNDAHNRSRLLDAAASLDPRWVMFLDADERIPPDDAAALRSFLENDADPDDAYLFRVYRMIDDLAHYDQAHLWVGRLFAYRSGLRLPDQALHLVPLPTSIPVSRRRRTTIRIQHLGSLNDEERRARFEKYREADPDRTQQAEYSSLLAPAGRVRAWWPRSRHLPVLAHDPVPDPPGTVGNADPFLSVVVIAQDDEARIEQVVRAISTQECAESFEIIVVTSGRDRTAAIVRDRFPHVDVVALDHAALPGEARNAGLRRARGRYVTFPGSHVQVQPGSLAAQNRAHGRGYAMVMGSMLNGTQTKAGWASYFLDHSSALPNRPSQPLSVAPARCSYLREALLELGGFPEDLRAGEDTVCNIELFERGYSACRAQDMIFVHRSPCSTIRTLIAHHFVRGKAMGRILFDDAVSRGRLSSRRVVRFVLYVSTAARLVRTSGFVLAWGAGLRGLYVRTFPLVVLAATSSWLGGCSELARLRIRVGRRKRSTDRKHGGGRW
ncbi:MAG: glycosyltransferase family 2 protein [Acidimicrobiia bacterium]